MSRGRHWSQLRKYDGFDILFRRPKRFSQSPMVDLDRFESQFRASVKERPVFEPPDVRSVLIITDLDATSARSLEGKVKTFLSALDVNKIEWRTIGADEIHGVRSMLDHVEKAQPSLIVSYRHLFEDDKDLPHSLGTYADMLIQALTTPVLLLPNPHRPDLTDKLRATQRVVLVTDHIVGDQRLVNWGLCFVNNTGLLQMVNIEDDQVFKRYIEVISKIPDLDTELAHKSIERQLIHEAEDFLSAWAAGIKADYAQLDVETLVQLGHSSQDYIRIAQDADADLVVFNTLNEGQLAMHGIAYALAVELLHRPLLML